VKVKNLFILNETYPLPLDKYAEFKSRKDGCKNNPMCTNKLKFDAETFIVGFAKKHGKKIETGEESSFVFVDDEEPTSNFTGTDSAKKLDNTQMILIGLITAIAVYALIKKNIMTGGLAFLLAFIYVSIEKPKPNS
jgi:hypothetical protein